MFLSLSAGASISFQRHLSFIQDTKSTCDTEHVKFDIVQY